MEIKDLKKGSVLSETSFFTVVEVNKDGIIVTDDNGLKLGIEKAYAETVLNSADTFEREEKKTMTELADILINSPRIAMTVAFFKKDTAKTKKAYEAEKAEAIKKVQSASLSTAATLLADLIDNPISKVIPGELRVMKGRHYGHVDDLGRVHFVDMELPKKIEKNKDGVEYDTRMRQIDPRTVQYIIVNETKYSLK